MILIINYEKYHKKEDPMKKEKITISRETYTLALAVERNNFIRYYCGRLERNGGDDAEAECYLRGRAEEFPLILYEYGPGALNRENFYSWSRKKSREMPNNNQEHHLNIGNISGNLNFAPQQNITILSLSKQKNF